MHCAATLGHLDILAYLIKNGANINAVVTFDLTSGHVASRQKYINYLKEYGNTDQIEKSAKVTPLYLSVRYGHLECTKHLVEKGAKYTSQLNILDVAAAEGHLDIFNFLLEKDSDHCDCLHYAIFGGNLEIVRILLEKGTNINKPIDLCVFFNCMGFRMTQTYFYPIHFACICGHNELVRFHDSNGADLKAVTNSKESTLHLECKSGHLELIKYLIEKGADINARADYGKTPLHFASESGNLELVKYFIECKF